jgi:hypothetical protein
VPNFVISSGKKIPQACGTGVGKYCSMIRGKHVNMVLNNGQGTH